MTGNPFADGPRPSRARNAAASLGRLAARTLSITIASLCVAWVAFPQTREPIGAAIDSVMPSTQDQRTDEWARWQMSRPLSLAPFCPDPYLVRIRWDGADLSPASGDCAVFIPVMEYRSVPVHVIRIDRALGD